MRILEVINVPLSPRDTPALKSNGSTESGLSAADFAKFAAEFERLCAAQKAGVQDPLRS